MVKNAPTIDLTARRYKNRRAAYYLHIIRMKNCLVFTSSFFADEEGVIALMKVEEVSFTKQYRQLGPWLIKREDCDY